MNQERSHIPSSVSRDRTDPACPCPDIPSDVSSELEERVYALIAETSEDENFFSKLEAAWPEVEAALPLFVAGSNERLQEVCDALAPFLLSTGRWYQRNSLSQQAEAKAVAAGDHGSAGWRAYQSGWVHFLRGEAEEVLACARRAALHWQNAMTGTRERAVVLHLRARGYQLNGECPAAITAFRRALKLWRSLAPESVDLAIDLNGLAEAERLSGDYAAAEQHYGEALRMARVLDYKAGTAAGTGNLAALALGRNDWPEAEALARKALPLSEKLGRLEVIAHNCHCLSQALIRQGKTAEALPHARRAVEVYEHFGSPHLAHARATLQECANCPREEKR